MAYPGLLASRILDDLRNSLSSTNDASVVGYFKANLFILATQIGTNDVDTDASSYKLQWRNVTDGGAFADVASTGQVKWATSVILGDGTAVTSTTRRCTAPAGMTWQNGLENEADNLLPDSGTLNLASDCYTELQWALSLADAHDGDQYEFQLYSVTGSVAIGTCASKITTLVGQATSQVYSQVEYGPPSMLKTSQVYAQVEYVDPNPNQKTSQVYAQVEYIPLSPGQYVSQIYAQVEYVPAGENQEATQSSSGGPVFSGSSTIVGVNYNWTGPIIQPARGGIKLGGTVGINTTLKYKQSTRGGIKLGGFTGFRLNPWRQATVGGIKLGGRVGQIEWYRNVYVQKAWGGITYGTGWYTGDDPQGVYYGGTGGYSFIYGATKGTGKMQKYVPGDTGWTGGEI